MLQVGGFTPFSTIDYPGCISAVVFCQGCSWRCRYCHNPSLLPFGVKPVINWYDVIKILQRRIGLLDAVVFSGGEPLRQDYLLAAIKEVKHLGFSVGLHTSGCDPYKLSCILPLINWVGLDIKGSVSKYKEITGSHDGGAHAWASLENVLDSCINYEVRVTVDPELFTVNDLVDVISRLRNKQVNNIIIQIAYKYMGADILEPYIAVAKNHGIKIR